MTAQLQQLLDVSNIESRFRGFCPPVGPSDPWSVERAIRYIRAGDWPRSHHYSNYYNLLDTLVWCDNHFGQDFVWANRTIFFKNDADYTLFLLRWS